MQTLCAHYKEWNDSAELDDQLWTERMSKIILKERDLHYAMGVEAGDAFLRMQHGCQQTVDRRWFVVMTDREIAICVQYIADEINRRFKNQKVVLCGILKGAYIFMSDLTKLLQIPYTTYFVEASSYGDSQEPGDMQVLSRLVPEKFVGRKVILLDELFDRGTTMHKISQCLLGNKELRLRHNDLFTCTLFAKQVTEAGECLPRPDLIGIDGLPDLWLVGYGLDDCGEKRGWKHLFACPKSNASSCVLYDDAFSPNPATSERMRRNIRARIFETLSEY